LSYYYKSDTFHKNRQNESRHKNDRKPFSDISEGSYFIEHYIAICFMLT